MKTLNFDHAIHDRNEDPDPDWQPVLQVSH